jgi:1,4-alpha-glucan branching enzyme
MAIGAIYDAERGGTAFQLWAPDAAAAHVEMRRNGGAWGAEVAMARQTDGYWDHFEPGLGPADEYRLILTDGSGNRFERLDPASRDTHDSALQPGSNAAIVVNPAQRWAPFRTPRFDELILYQLHVGTFSGRNDHCQTWPAKFKDVETKLQYVRDLGFNAIAFLPVQEWCMDRSWGYNPAFFFAPESSYGSPADLRRLVDAAHQRGLAVIFDVVFNHVSDADNSLWAMDVHPDSTGIYLQEYRTPWGHAPAFWKEEVKEFFVENALMYVREYRADGLRFDATRAIEAAGGLDADGWRFLQYLTWNLKQAHPDRYLVAEHLPDHETIVTSAGFHGTWCADAHHEFQRAARGSDSVSRIRAIIGKDLGEGRRYPNGWNLVKSLLGSHDDCGDDKGGATESDPDDTKQHRYFVELFGGRSNWHARAKARLGWALNTACVGTPMLFMGGECYMWGYWTDGEDGNGDHRFDWSIAGDPLGMEMRRFVAAANAVRAENPCLRGDFAEVTHEDRDNSIIAFKRWLPGRPGTILAIVNCGDHCFSGHDYGVATGGQPGQWTQILCTQDVAFGGWEGAGNAFHEPWTQDDGRIYLNLPLWSVVLMRVK